MSIRIITDNEYKRMLKNGWQSIHQNACGGSIKAELEKKYTQVKEYYVTTRIRGYYNTIYMIK